MENPEDVKDKQDEIRTDGGKPEDEESSSDSSGDNAGGSFSNWLESTKELFGGAETTDEEDRAIEETGRQVVARHGDHSDASSAEIREFGEEVEKDLTETLNGGMNEGYDEVGVEENRNNWRDHWENQEFSDRRVDQENEDNNYQVSEFEFSEHDFLQRSRDDVIGLPLEHENYDSWTIQELQSEVSDREIAQSNDSTKDELVGKLVGDDQSGTPGIYGELNVRGVIASIQESDSDIANAVSEAFGESDFNRRSTVDSIEDRAKESAEDQTAVVRDIGDYASQHSEEYDIVAKVVKDVAEETKEEEEATTALESAENLLGDEVDLEGARQNDQRVIKQLKQDNEILLEDIEAVTDNASSVLDTLYDEAVNLGERINVLDMEASEFLGEEGILEHIYTEHALGSKSAYESGSVQLDNEIYGRLDSLYDSLDNKGERFQAVLEGTQNAIESMLDFRNNLQFNEEPEEYTQTLYDRVQEKSERLGQFEEELEQIDGTYFDVDEEAGDVEYTIATQELLDEIDDYEEFENREGSRAAVNELTSPEEMQNSDPFQTLVGA